jgi:hypothetical protein
MLDRSHSDVSCVPDGSRTKFQETSQMNLKGIRGAVGDVAWIQRQRGVGPATVWREYRRFKSLTRMTPAECLRYWLWDESIPMGHRLALMSRQERLLAEPRLNPPEQLPRHRNKAWVASLFEAAGVRTGPLIGYVGRENNDRYTPEGIRWIEFDEVGDFLGDAPDTGVVFKPIYGSGGDSVMVFRKACATHLEDLLGNEWSIERLIAVISSGSRQWRVEHRVPQHSRLAAVSGETLGTLRMIAARLDDGSVHLGPTSWKIPTIDDGLDHFMHGELNLAAPVDPATGRVGPARRWKSVVPADTHPVSKARITDVVMPWWDEAQDLVRRATGCLDGVRGPAFDIGIGEDGAFIVEMNLRWGEPLTQTPGIRGLVTGPFLKLLHERGCDDVMNLAIRDENPVC